jgi:hypothetical protein
VFDNFATGRVDCRFEDGIFGDFAILLWVRGKVLETCLIPHVQPEAPDEVRGEAADQDDDENGQALPKRGRSVFQGEGFDWAARRKSVGKAGAHHARKDRDTNSFLEIEFFDGRLLFFERHNALFANARDSSGGDAQQANENARENDATGRCSKNLGEKYTAEDRRHQRTNRGAKAQDHSHTQ